MKNVLTVTVILKDESRTMKQKHLLYDVAPTCSQHDEIIANLISDTKSNFVGNATDIIVNIQFSVL